MCGYLILGRDSSKLVMDFFFLVMSFYRSICQTFPQRSNGGKCGSMGPIDWEPQLNPANRVI
jgi:hypothetical protein